MPCDSITTTTIDFKGADVDILEAALKSAGYETIRDSNANLFFRSPGEYWNSLKGGVLEITGQSQTADKIRRIYGAEAVKRAAGKYGWTVKSTGENKFTISRRA